MTLTVCWFIHTYIVHTMTTLINITYLLRTALMECTLPMDTQILSVIVFFLFYYVISIHL